MQLSAEAIRDLRCALNQTFGLGFDDKFSETETNEIGLLLLSILAESLKCPGTLNPKAFNKFTVNHLP